MQNVIYPTRSIRVELEVQLEKLAEAMIEAHYDFNFKEMSFLMDQSVISQEGTFFKEEKFKQVCETLKNNCGKLISIESLGILNKVDSLQTLWKVKYSETEREMLWQMIVTDQSGEYKIVSMSVN